MPATAYAEAAYRVRDEGFWSAWALRALLALGAAHVLAGIVFFFAFNWADMPVYAKFGVVQAGIVIAALAALVTGLDKPVGQTLLIAASVLTGVLLAVFGQIYQTGADAYELFVSWTLLILPWVLISRSAAHWLVWLTVACLAVGLYCEQILVPLKLLESEQVLVVVGVLLAVALMARELALRIGLTWLAPGWVRYVLVFAALGCLFLPAVAYVFEWDGTWISAAAFLAAMGAALVVYQRILPDFGGFALATGFGAFLLMAVGGRLISDTIGFEEDDFSILFALAVMTAWCVGVTGGMARLLTLLRPGFGGAGG